MRNNYTPQEQKNIELVKEYMQIAYDPRRASAEAVAHLCYFWLVREGKL
ncbi:hypothetical protein [Scytonema sp. NUACC26]